MFALFVLCPVSLALAPIALVLWPIMTTWDWAVEKYRNRQTRKFYQELHQEPSPSEGLLTTYFWAVKNKVCPMIEYTDG